MVKEIIQNEVKIKSELNRIIQKFFKSHNEHPSSINIKVIPEKKNESVCIQVKITD